MGESRSLYTPWTRYCEVKHFSDLRHPIIVFLVLQSIETKFDRWSHELNLNLSVVLVLQWVQNKSGYSSKLCHEFFERLFLYFQIIAYYRLLYCRNFQAIRFSAFRDRAPLQAALYWQDADPAGELGWDSGGPVCRYANRRFHWRPDFRPIYFLHCTIQEG